MGKKMLVNVLHPEEARVAIVQDGVLMDLNIERSGKEQTKGNIYKGVVARVEPGLQAAFVDIGQKKPGFIQMGDLHSDFWQWRDDLPEDERKKRPRIQEILRRGQELIVQVEKDARDQKGAALTSYLSLPGRYMVLMPGDTAAGISRKIEDNVIRKELKSLVSEMNVPEGYGYIVRTEAAGRSLDELSRDLEYLVGVHSRIRQQAEAVKGAALIYQDSGLIVRTLRDYFSDDIEEILVDDKIAFQQAIDFLLELMPGYEKRVKLHREKRPIFSKYQLEEQIDRLYEKRVSLATGGSLVIEPTEALVSIDVNSGKSNHESGIEDTAYKTNLEAAKEVARQLRLRDLGGLIVIDFIDMRNSKHIKEVEQVLKEALKYDKARVHVGHISQFGMLEMSRQRISKNITEAIHLECPHCEGRGQVKSVESVAISFLRKVHAAAAKGQITEVRGELPLEIAYYLLNRKKRELAQIENDYEIVVNVKGKPSFMMNQIGLEAIRKEKVVAQDAAKPEQPVESSEVAVIETETKPEPTTSDTVTKPKKRSRRSRHSRKTADARDIRQETAIEQITDVPASQSDEAVQAIGYASPEPASTKAVEIIEETLVAADIAEAQAGLKQEIDQTGDNKAAKPDKPTKTAKKNSNVRASRTAKAVEAEKTEKTADDSMPKTKKTAKSKKPVKTRADAKQTPVLKSGQPEEVEAEEVTSKTTARKNKAAKTTKTDAKSVKEAVTDHSESATITASTNKEDAAKTVTSEKSSARSKKASRKKSDGVKDVGVAATTKPDDAVTKAPVKNIEPDSDRDKPGTKKSVRKKVAKTSKPAESKEE